MENNNDTHRIKRSSSAWLGEMREFLRGRFSLDEDRKSTRLNSSHLRIAVGGVGV